MMKKVRFCLPVFLALVFFSCNNEGVSFTPYVQVSHFLVNPVYDGEQIVAAEDTLSFVFQDNCYVLDSINLNDTIVFAAGFGSYANDLVAARVLFDATQLNFSAKITDKIRKILLPDSDEKNLQFVLNAGYNYLTIPFGYRPSASGTHQFTLKVESDSKFSPSSITFLQPVR